MKSYSGDRSCWCEGIPGPVRLMVKFSAGSRAPVGNAQCCWPGLAVGESKAGVFVSLFFVSTVLSYIVFVHFCLPTQSQKCPIFLYLRLH